VDVPAIVAVSGGAGAGKTTLAVRAARRIVEAFPGGQLHARLRGPGGQPVDPLVVLQRFLRALGVRDEAVPDDVDECAALFRSRSAGRRLLILLDAAADEAQVRPLLPGAPTCAVLVTSRSRLCGLEGARLVDLDGFGAEESVELLRRVAGRQRIDSDPGAVLSIARSCGHLPLAVRIAGIRFAQRPDGDLARFARRLADERRRLDLLAAGHLDVRASLDLSYRSLGPRAAAAFALLGLLDAADFGVRAVARLLGIAPAEAEDVVEELVTARLLDVAGRGAAGRSSFCFHGLVRLYARELAGAEQGALA